VTDRLQFKLSFPKFGFAETFDFNSGLHVLYGESGSGKSAFVNQILGRDKDYENFELSISSCPEEMQKVFQNPDTQIVSSTLEGELAFSLECRSADQEYISAELTKIKEDLFFKSAAHRHPATLSGGEKEMLNVLTACSVRPQLVLIDDGLSFLNTDKKKEVVQYIQDRIDDLNCIVLWFTSDCNDLHFGVTQWELTLQALKPWTGEIKPLLRVEHKTGSTMSITCQNLSFNYDGAADLFDDFNLHIDSFRALGITGANGSGKTTIAKLLLAIEQPESGSIKLCKNSSKANIAYLEQFPEKMVGVDSLDVFVQRLLAAGKLDKHKINHAINNLKNCQLEWEQIKEKTALDLPWSTLRLALTIWLLNSEYDLLILDEPTFGLGREQVLTLTRHLQLYVKNKYLLIISHDTEFIYTFCDRVFDMDQNTVLTGTEKITSNE
jgi:energy-coupling factor transporter ATP-binding protein EcfA2|tara:strand:- start:10658 stop:11971 length:1314 start_codon:yes stop_codon:yes gene_type:complete